MEKFEMKVARKLDFSQAGDTHHRHQESYSFSAKIVNQKMVIKETPVPVPSEDLTLPALETRKEIAVEYALYPPEITMDPTVQARMEQDIKEAKNTALPEVDDDL